MSLVLTMMTQTNKTKRTNEHQSVNAPSNRIVLAPNSLKRCTTASECKGSVYALMKIRAKANIIVTGLATTQPTCPISNLKFFTCKYDEEFLFIKAKKQHFSI